MFSVQYMFYVNKVMEQSKNKPKVKPKKSFLSIASESPFSFNS